MNAKTVLAASLLALSSSASADPMQGPYIRLAELEIDPARLEEFSAAIRDGIETAIRVEPGVLALHAVFEKDDPARVRVFEIYTDEGAYRTHLQTPHFLRFRTTTETMIRSRRLLDAVPIMLGAKSK
ncbi:putative quinol monooxygenase [Mycobacterium sp. KBS0706]|uniref:putative quinol monooxygenase n=1 Tax=Mycobacterium sp. KBS0706 TaxID=2578109 RepID=UPI00163D3EB0|nr:putative quinol monooxygenase [Mycobacterium sp. KBS0706]